MIPQCEISSTAGQLTTISRDTTFISNNNCLLSSIIQSLSYCAPVSIIKGVTFIIGFDYSAWHTDKGIRQALLLLNLTKAHWPERAVHFQVIIAAIHQLAVWTLTISSLRCIFSPKTCKEISTFSSSMKQFFVFPVTWILLSFYITFFCFCFL